MWNINWQDWKCTAFVVFIRQSQNNRRHNALGNTNLMADVVKTLDKNFIFNQFNFT